MGGEKTRGRGETYVSCKRGGRREDHLAVKREESNLPLGEGTKRGNESSEGKPDDQELVA